MTGNKPQFDDLLGGAEELPLEISIMKIASARAQEIVALTEAIEDPLKTALMFQRLPKLMRRRVMSHNAKRMPRRLREAHVLQLEKSGFPPKPKRPSRKYRRRPQNLLQEYNRRQRKFVWLETHIWHAKRFHMIDKWGYKIANFPNDKSFRACYRASANHCLLQDMSFYCCIELCGRVEHLLDGLASLTDARCGLTFGAKAFLSGYKEGALTVFRPGMYPYGAIGSVRFLWRCGENVEGFRTLWLWIHPANYMEILSELNIAFGFSQGGSIHCDEMDIEKEFSNISSPVKKKARLEKCLNVHKNVEQIKLATRNTSFQTPKYQNSTGKVQMTLLKDTINRFRLTGPLSQAILSHALNVPDIKDTQTTKTECTSSTANQTRECSDIVRDCTSDIAVQSSSKEDTEVEPWWVELYGKNLGYQEAWQAQRDLWVSLRGVASPAQLPPHAVLALTVLDPRIQMPAKRTKVLPDQSALFEQRVEFQPGTSRSPIWDAVVRDEVTLTKRSAADLARMRSSNLVPGFSVEEQIIPTKHTLIPLLLLQRPGSQEPLLKRLGFGCGWDVVIPAGWAMPLWLALVFRGARVGGLRETTALEFEGGGEPWSGSFAPDTAAGREEANVKLRQLMDQHFRLPPSKRPNFIKLGIVSPFSCCWDVLIRDWCQEEPMDQSQCLSRGPFYVLRDRDKLCAFKNAIESSRKCKCLRERNRLCCLCHTSNHPDVFSACGDIIQQCLVPSTIVIHKKGCVVDFAIICIPSQEDIMNLQKDPNFPGPVEPLHNDSGHQERKEARIQHQKLLKCLRKRRIRNKRRLELESDSLSAKNLSCEHSVGSKEVTADLVDKQASRMQALWLPEADTVKNSCSRTVIGFMYKGDFSFTEARGVGTGYVALPGLLQLLRSSLQAVVLVRNPSSLQYRFAMLHIH